MKRKPIRRLMSIVLALMLVICLLPSSSLTAHAAGTSTCDTFAELKTALENPAVDTVKVASFIETVSQNDIAAITVKSNSGTKNLVLEGNAHIKAGTKNNGYRYFITVEEDITLNVSGDGALYTDAVYTDEGNATFRLTGGELHFLDSFTGTVGITTEFDGACGSAIVITSGNLLAESGNFIADSDCSKPECQMVEHGVIHTDVQYQSDAYVALLGGYYQGSYADDTVVVSGNARNIYVDHIRYYADAVSVSAYVRSRIVSDTNLSAWNPYANDNDPSFVLADLGETGKIKLKLTQSSAGNAFESPGIVQSVAVYERVGDSNWEEVTRRVATNNAMEISLGACDTPTVKYYKVVVEYEYDYGDNTITFINEREIRAEWKNLSYNGAGTKENPVKVSTFDELRRALGDTSIEYVQVVSDIEKTLNFDAYKHSGSNSPYYRIRDYQMGLISAEEIYQYLSSVDVTDGCYGNGGRILGRALRYSALQVYGEKHLILSEDVKLNVDSFPMQVDDTGFEYGIEINSNLTISGGGTFEVSLTSPEKGAAAILSELGATLIIEDARIIAKTEQGTGIAHAIRIANGSPLIIDDGEFRGEVHIQKSGYNKGFYTGAVYVEDGYAEINGGIFGEVEFGKNNTQSIAGLMIYGDYLNRVSINGGTYETGLMKESNGYGYNLTANEWNAVLVSGATYTTNTFTKNGVEVTSATVTPGKRAISSAVLTVPTNGSKLAPVGGKTCSNTPASWFSVPNGAVYELKTSGSGYAWYDEKGNAYAGKSFDAGKTYYLELPLKIKDAYAQKYAFDEAFICNISADGLDMGSIVKTVCEFNNGKNEVIVRYYFTASYAEGVGTTPENPADCSDYAQLKYALQHPEIKYIRVNSFKNTTGLSYYALMAGTDYDKGDSAINIPATTQKYLEINTNINLRANQLNGLMYSFIHNPGSLYVSGNGSLNVSFNANGYPCAIILNQGGYLEVSGVTLDATNYTFDDQHGYAIYNDYGTTVIHSGTFIGCDSSAVTYNRGTLTIYDGDFQVGKNADGDYALSTSSYLSAEEHNVTLYGGTYEGILAENDTNANKAKLSDLLAYNAYYAYTNGTKFNPGNKEKTSETLMVVQYAQIEDVELTVTDPKEGNKPSYSIGTADDSYRANGNSYNYTDHRQWMESADGVNNWRTMETTDKFRAGYYYKLYVDVVAVANDTRFAVTDDGVRIAPDVSATMNGKQATVFKTIDQDPAEYITVMYNFGMLNESIIKKIEIVDIVAPVPGEHPSYTATALGTGYKLDPAEGRDHWDGTLYKTNGVIWYDEDWNILYETDTFEAGKNYMVRIYVDVADADVYKFDYDSQNDVTRVTATVNGNAADVREESNAYWDHQVTYLFEWEPVLVNNIAITELERPVAGQTPDLTMTMGSSLYTPDTESGMEGSGIQWYTEDGYEMSADDTFVEGEIYRVCIDIVPAKVDDMKLCKFSTRSTATINGVEVTRGSWDEVSARTNSVTIWYTFPATIAGGLVGPGSSNPDGFDVERVWGASRYKTSLAIAEKLRNVLRVSKFDTVIIACGTNFPDALAGSYLSAKAEAPILMVNDNVGNISLVQNYINENVVSGGKVYILGGSAAVPESIENNLKGMGYDVERLKGKGRYDTNLEILKEAGVSSEPLLVCTGTNFADSLSASASGLPMLLVDPNTKKLTEAQKAFLAEGTRQIYIIGGSGAVSDLYIDALAEHDTDGNVERIKGKNRYETSVEVAKKFAEDPTNAIVASASNFPDGLCGGPLAYFMDAPLILTSPTVNANNMAPAVSYITGKEIKSGKALGGSGAIADGVVKAIFGMGADVQITGTRYD